MDTQAIFDIQNRIAAKIRLMRQRIDRHRDYIGGHETRTRQLLIDPMLRVLEWDLEDPAQVHLEFKSESGKPDYALLSNDQVVAVIEAKALGKNLEASPGQIIRYGTDQDLPDLRLVCKSDGDRWFIYTVRPISGDEAKLDISKREPLESAQTFMRLFRDAFADALGSSRGYYADDGNGENPSSIEDQPYSYPGSDFPDHQRHRNELGEGWRSVADRTFSPTGRRAVAVSFADDRFEVKNLTDAFVEIIRRLAVQGLLTRNHCPIKSTEGGAKYVVATEPLHENGNRFGSAVNLPTGLIIDTKYSSAAKMDMLRNLLELSGFDAEKIAIKWR